MENYYKYLPVSAKDDQWGLSVLNTGCTRILPHTPYPFQSHPSHHYFNWQNGRVLQEYQVVYIARGEGYFESTHTQPCRIRSGTVFLLFPGERHRYKPSAETGWDEYWVGFRGAIADGLVENGFLNPAEAALAIGHQERLLNLFLEIIEETKQERTGYQPLIAGALMHLLGTVQSTAQQQHHEGKDTEALVKKAQTLFRANLNEDLSPEQVAAELGVSYSKFRKIFKDYTGLAPGQYQIQLKVQQAKVLLLEPGKQVKEIAYELHYGSIFYFSKLFKEKTGLTPVQYRKYMLGA